MDAVESARQALSTARRSVREAEERKADEATMRRVLYVRQCAEDKLARLEEADNHIRRSA